MIIEKKITNVHIYESNILDDAGNGLEDIKVCAENIINYIKQENIDALKSEIDNLNHYWKNEVEPYV